MARGQMEEPDKGQVAGPVDLAALQAAQGEANSKPGPRSVPAKVVPVPNDVGNFLGKQPRMCTIAADRSNLEISVRLEPKGLRMNLSPPLGQPSADVKSTLRLLDSDT